MRYFRFQFQFSVSVLAISVYIHTKFKTLMSIRLTVCMVKIIITIMNARSTRLLLQLSLELKTIKKADTFCALVRHCFNCQCFTIIIVIFIQLKNVKNDELIRHRLATFLH